MYQNCMTKINYNGDEMKIKFMRVMPRAKPSVFYQMSSLITTSARIIALAILIKINI